MTTPSATSAAVHIAYDRQEVTPSYVVQQALERIHRDAELNAYHAVTEQQALRAAEESDQRRGRGAALGPLDGIPVTVKENFARRGVTMPAGTDLPDPPVAEHDSPIIQRLQEAGAVILGSTVMPDWGMLSSGVSSRHGITRSPWNGELTTGGSSSGAGVSAAAAHGPVHIGSDIGGSVRLPGTWNGLATLKPSAGLIPLDAPYIGRAAGPMARHVEDLFIAMQVLAQWDDRDYSSHPYPLTDFSPRVVEPASLSVGVHLDGVIGHPLDPQVRQVVLEAADIFAEAGAEVTAIDPITTEELLSRIDRFWRARSLNTLQKLPRHQQDEYVLDYIARWCRGAQGVSAATAVSDFEALGELGARTRRMTREYDVVISPVTQEPAFAAEQPMPRPDPDHPMGHISYTLPFNMSGQPAGTINAGQTADGRWIGLQVSGRIGADAEVLAVLAWWEQIRPKRARPSWEHLDAQLNAESSDLA